jgi:hypothetical protein
MFKRPCDLMRRNWQDQAQGSNPSEWRRLLRQHAYVITAPLWDSIPGAANHAACIHSPQTSGRGITRPALRPETVGLLQRAFSRGEVSAGALVVDNVR